jgi:hypothetical protein
MAPRVAAPAVYQRYQRDQRDPPQEVQAEAEQRQDDNDEQRDQDYRHRSLPLTSYQPVELPSSPIANTPERAGDDGALILPPSLL